MTMLQETETLNQLSRHAGEVLFGIFFLFIGLIGLLVAALRRDKNARILVWLALWSGTYGLRLMISSQFIGIIAPQWVQPYLTYIGPDHQ